MNFDSPFFVIQVECPVCGEINEFESIKARAYTETERDTDFCPRGIIWANPEYQKTNPLLYFMATCSNCFYTHEFNQSYKEWKKNHYFAAHHLSSIRKEHQRELKQVGSVIRKLSEALDPEGHPFESAVFKLLLGIRDETMIEQFNPWDVGRHYLRIAWLYREQGEEKKTAGKMNELNLTSLEGRLTDLGHRLQNQEEEIHDLWMAAVGCFRHSAGIAEEDRQREHLGIRITTGLNKIHEDISSLRESLGELGEICAESKNRSVAFESGNIETATGAGEDSLSGKTLQARKDRSIFDNFLASIKETWPGTPLNEREAIKWALRYYKQSYQEIKDVEQENQKIQAIYLIAELSRRVGDYAEAKSYFDQAERIGQDFIEKNEDDLNKIVLAQRIVQLAKRQGELNSVKTESHV